MSSLVYEIVDCLQIRLAFPRQRRILSQVPFLPIRRKHNIIVFEGKLPPSVNNCLFIFCRLTLAQSEMSKHFIGEVCDLPSVQQHNVKDMPTTTRYSTCTRTYVYWELIGFFCFFFPASLPYVLKNNIHSIFIKIFFLLYGEVQYFMIIHTLWFTLLSGPPSYKSGSTNRAPYRTDIARIKWPE